MTSFAFHRIALELLVRTDELPPPIMDGFEEDPYLNKVDYTRLGMIVCERVPLLTLKIWWEATPGQRLVYMVKAVESQKAEAVEQPDDCYREGKQSDGELLVSGYLVDSPEWPFFTNRNQLTRAWKAGKVQRIKTYDGFAYHYDDLAGLSRTESMKDEDP